MKKQESTKGNTEEEKLKVKNDARQWLSGLIIGILIVACIWWFVSSISETEEDIVDCAQDCVSDLGFCTIFSIIYDANRNAYIPNDEYESCSLDLESCIDDCSTS